MSEMVTISFQVPVRAAREMQTRSVYLDVFGNVRWMSDTDMVSGSTGWSITLLAVTA